MKKYKVDVQLNFIANDEIEVSAKSKKEAEEKVKELIKNKEYKPKLRLDATYVMVLDKKDL